MLVQCTKKLTAELKPPLSEEVAEAPSVFDWHAHLFLFRRRKCVLVMNNRTRYNFVMYGMRKAEFQRFEEHFMEQLALNLAADEIGTTIAQHYMKQSPAVHYGRTSNRSILSQINEMIWIAHSYMEENVSQQQDPEIAGVNRFLNRFIFMQLPELYAVEAMKGALQQLYDTSQ